MFLFSYAALGFSYFVMRNREFNWFVDDHVSHSDIFSSGMGR